MRLPATRPARGQADGDLPPGADIDALAAYASTGQFGMSLQARDGATWGKLSAVVDRAVAGLVVEASADGAAPGTGR